MRDFTGFLACYAFASSATHSIATRMSSSSWLYSSAQLIDAGIVESILESLRRAPILSLIYLHRNEGDSAGNGSCRGIANSYSQRQAAVCYVCWCDVLCHHHANVTDLSLFRSTRQRPGLLTGYPVMWQPRLGEQPRSLDFSLYDRSVACPYSPDMPLLVRREHTSIEYTNCGERDREKACGPRRDRLR